MDETIVLRAAEIDDRPRTNAVQWSAGWQEPPTRHRIWPEADADWQARRYYKEYVAEVDGVIAARVGLEAYRPPFAELCNLSVRPDYQRRGLGKMLTQTCLREAARRGFVALFLQTELDNRGAHHLYTGMDFVPTAHGKMLRLLKFLDYPLLADFRRLHPLNQYRCLPAGETGSHWNLEWHGYICDDLLRLRLEGGSCQSDSDGIGPALTACDWRIDAGARQLSLELQRENARDLEPGNHVELQITLRNTGKRMESGTFQMILPPGVEISAASPGANRAFTWEAAPGEEIVQPVTLLIEEHFDAGTLWYLNYDSLSVSVESYWEGHRALLSTSLPMAAPPPSED